MALAVTPFTALCGFLPVEQIKKYLQSTPELAALIPASVREEFDSTSDIKPTLKALFFALMNAEKATFGSQLDKLVARYQAGDAKEEEKPLVELVLRLNEQFPQDIGVFCPFVLNYVKLQPGEAIFLGAGEPHAYVTGGRFVLFGTQVDPANCCHEDIMECMATSDNVIRAGLTPKLRDIPNLVSGLTYEPSEPTKHVVDAVQFQSSSKTLLFNPPVPEFSVLQVKLAAGSTESHRSIGGPSIAVVTDGNGSIDWGGQELAVSLGQVIFIGADTEVEFKAEKEFVVYRAFVEVEK